MGLVPAWRAAGLISLAGFAMCGSTRQTTESSELPFSIGEKLSFAVTVPKMGKVGTATMWVEGPVDVRGTSTYLLRFDSRIRIALINATSQSSSWFDPDRRLSLRFFKRERNPLSRHDESVNLFPEKRAWQAADGKTGVSLDDQPLDELSFIYFIRTLPMKPGATYRFDRHFDSARNPVSITVVRREVIPTPMGELKVFLVEMRVHDPAHYEAEGLIRIHITDDACRLPVRIESSMQVIGTAVLTISAQNSRCNEG